MMNIQGTYLMLLRKAIGLDGEMAKWPNGLSGEAIEQIVQLAQRQGTGPLVFNELLKTLSDSPSKGESRAPNPNPSLQKGREIDGAKTTGDRLQAMTMQMKQICMQNMLLQGQWEQVIKKTFQTLEQGGVQAVLMKGFAYARLYPLPYLRSWGDLDIWVGPEQYHQACGLLREAFPEAKHHDEEWDELKHYCFVFPDGKSIELHRVSMDFINKRDQAYWCRLEKEAFGLKDDGVRVNGERLEVNGERFEVNSERLEVNGERLEVNSERLEVNSERVPMWEPKFDILFCFMHSWEHFCGSGIPLKQVCDLALLVKTQTQALPLKREGGDCHTTRAELEEYLEKHLKALKMLEVWKYYGYMACKALGIPMTEWPLLVSVSVSESDSVSERVMRYGERLYDRVMEEGQCRAHDYDGAANRYEARDNAKQMNIIARKLQTLKCRIDKARFLNQFAPAYTRYMLKEEIKKGIRRTITGAKMIDY